MLRCVLAAAALVAVPAAAQVQRNFPADALRGEIAVLQPPELRLNGKPARLAPGARIRGENNMLQMSGSLAGAKFVAHYTLDGHGLVKDVWVLTADERTRRPWPETPAEAKAWTFDPVAQRWSRP